MKKFLAVLVLFIFSATLCYAKNVQQYTSINYGGNKYFLLYSTKDKENGGYLNEYYRGGETYRNWSDMVAVHHFPNAYSPIDQVKTFREYLGSIGCPSALTFNDKKNIAIIDFVLINQLKDSTILEFNIFKYQKSKKCGSVAMQYAKRYLANNAMQVEMIKKDFEKQRKKSIRRVKGYNIPAIIYEEIDICKLPDDEKPETDQTTTASDAEIKEEHYDTSKNDNTQEDIKQEEVKNTESKEQENVNNDSDKDSNIKSSAIDNKTECTGNTEQTTTNNIKTGQQEDESEKTGNDIIQEKENSESMAQNVIQEKVTKPDKDEQLDSEVKDALVPSVNNSPNDKKVKDKKTKEKKIKEKKVKEKKVKQKKDNSYNITNEKDEFYAKPPTKKEIKKKNKQIKYERSLKAKKDRVKNAEKFLSE